MVAGKMKAIMAESIGFCFGVERAYNMSLDLLGEGSCQMLGHLVHNEKVVDEIRSKGLQFISDVDEAGDGTVIIRAHGVGEETMERLRARGLTVISCPTCARTKTPVEKIAIRFEKLLSEFGSDPLTVVVMGCIVNGLGEAREADLAFVGIENRKASFFRKGKFIENIDPKKIIKFVNRLAKNNKEKDYEDKKRDEGGSASQGLS